MKILGSFKRKIRNVGIGRKRQVLTPAELIDKYIRGNISKKEHNYLDWWVGNDPRNMKIFEDLTESISRKVTRKQKTESTIEAKARRIATLLAGYMRNNLTLDEQCELDEWIGASDKNLKLFKELTDPKRVQLALELFSD